TPGGAACRYNDIIPADHCLHDVQDTGNPFLMSYFTQTTDGRVNLMHHRKAGNTKLGEFGDYGNDWQTLELVFTAGSATVTGKRSHRG
ncbi:hypothetical protein ABGM49_005286, partial [Escherichia coli]